MDSPNPKNTQFVGLPASPRAQKHTLAPLDTTFNMMNTDSLSEKSSYSSLTASSRTYVDHQPSRQMFVDTRVRNHDSMIFVNATIPLSPTSSTSSQTSSQPMNGLTPRKRNGFARLFCCFGRDERARRRMERENDYEKVGNDSHWSEY